MPTLPLDRPVTDFLMPAGITLRDTHTVAQALADLRTTAATLPQSDSQVLYFYVVNAREQLVGILPSRQLILSASEAKVADLMTRNVIILSQRDRLFDALEQFAIHRLLAIPVVDDEKHLLGILPVSLYTDEVFDLAQNHQLNEVFQLIGVRLEQHRQGSPLRGFQLRMPWLLANITGGLICAALGSLFEGTLQKVVLIALFIPLILTLAESIAVQSMTLAIEEAMQRNRKPGPALRREAATALMLGVATAILVGGLSLLWRGPIMATVTISLALVLIMLVASILGRIVPAMIHRLKLNPRIASGPITLAAVDVMTIAIYLSAATILLH